MKAGSLSSGIIPWVEASADPGGKLFDKAEEMTFLLRDLTRPCAITLNAWDPISKTHHHQTLASDGYSKATLLHINDEFVKSDPAYAITHKDDSRSLRWRDFERDWRLFFPETFTAQTFLLPSGFKEGSTMCLRLPDGRYTGAVSMSWSSAAAATDERREVTERFRPILATLCDQLRTPQLLADTLAPNAFALVISSTGFTFQLSNRATGAHLGEDGALRRLLLEKVKVCTARRFIWADEDGLCHKVTITPCRDYVALVTEEFVPWPYDLSLREIQVLHLIASGASNPQIAQQLFISPRTASTHVEHILAKIDCSSRAQLAALAVSEGLLLAEAPSRRAVSRK